MKKLFLIPLIIVLVVGFVFGGCAKPAPPPAPAPAPPPPPVKPIVLVFSAYKPAAHYHVTDILQPWIAEIEKRSGGRVKVEAHYAGELVGLMDTYDALIKGTIDMGLFLPHHVIGKFPMHHAFALCPYDTIGWRPHRVYYELLQQFPQAQAQYEGIKPLLFFGPFASFVGTTKKPIRKLEDGEGLKMIMAGELAAERAKALGWVPMDAPPPAAYGMWEKGVADGGGVMAPGDIVGGNRWGEVLKYVTMVPMNRFSIALGMNLNKFNSLPPDIQKIMDDLMPEMIDLADKVDVLECKDAMVRGPEELGTEFIWLSPEELARWVAADKPVIDAYIASLEAQGLPGREFYDAYVQLEKKYSAAEYEFK